jgi:hypothetical protein
MISESESISAPAAEFPSIRKNAVLAIAVGAFIGGTINIVWVCIQEGWVIPLYISAGLLGRQAIHGGAPIWTLGLLLDFFIADVWATVYYLASRKLPFLTEHPFISGVNFGVWVQLFMLLVVLPYSGLHATEPVTLYGLAVKVLLFGLPVAYSIRYLAPATRPSQHPPLATSHKLLASSNWLLATSNYQQNSR